MDRDHGGQPDAGRRRKSIGPREAASLSRFALGGSTVGGSLARRGFEAGSNVAGEGAHLE